MIRFIDEHRDRFSVEFICATLDKQREGGFLSSRGYRDAQRRGPSARQLRDVSLVERIKEIHEANYSVYGVRKIWHALRRAGNHNRPGSHREAHAPGWCNGQG